MLIVLVAIGLLFFCGFAALLAGRNSGAANLIGPCGACLGGLLGLIEAVRILSTGGAEQFRCAWNVPVRFAFRPNRCPFRSLPHPDFYPLRRVRAI